MAVGAALVSGSLSLLAPYLASLTGALAALALAGWAVRRSAHLRGGPGASLGVAEGFGLGALALGGALFLAGPTPFLSVRGLVLAVSLLPLWAAARNLPSRNP